MKQDVEPNTSQLSSDGGRSRKVASCVGGVERSVKAFSRKMSYLSFTWRILLALVLWKDSLDFIAIVKNKSIDDEALTLEQRVE